MTSKTIKVKPTIFVFLLLVGCLTFYYFHSRSPARIGPTVNLKKLLEISLDLVRESGKKIVEIRRLPHLTAYHKVVSKMKQNAVELLTTADMTSHRIIKYGLIGSFEDLEVVSEEHDKKEDTDDEEGLLYVPSRKNVPEIEIGDDVPASDVLVWIDPLDATQEYTENLTNYVTNMICVVVKGEPVIGVIHKVFEQKTYWAYRDSKSSHVSWSSSEKTATTSGGDGVKPQIIVSRSHAGDVKEMIEKKFGGRFDVLPAGGSGYKTIEVLTGHATAYLHKTAIKKWDICAPDALVRISGGRVTNLLGDVIDYSDPEDFVNSRGLLITDRDAKAPLDHESFLKALKDANQSRR